MTIRNRLLAGAAGVALAATLAACGTTGTTTTNISGSTLTIYSSLPLNGPESSEAHDVLDAERLALQQQGHKVGKYTINLDWLTDATNAGWTPKLIAKNARTAVLDNDAIAYIGELDPDASAQSVPITNADNLLQVSPYDGTIGLTQATPADPGSPGKYYESLSTNGRTFARVVPSDAAQARAQLEVMRDLGVKKVFVVEDGTPYGDAIAYALQQDASKYGITATAPARSASGLASSGADALFYGGLAGPAAVQAFNGAVNGGAKVKLFGPSGLYTSAFAAQLSPAAQRVTYLSEPGLTTSELSSSGHAFISAFKATYHHAPWTQAIFGYAAMRAVLRAIANAGSNDGNRSDVVTKFFALSSGDSPLGAYSIDKQGDTSRAPYIFSRVKGGKLVAYKGLIAPS